jgi:AAA+ superfamily predicted ATPase
VFLCSNFQWKKVISASEGLSHSEIDLACRDAVKEAILSDKTKIQASALLQNIKEKQEALK